MKNIYDGARVGKPYLEPVRQTLNKFRVDLAAKIQAELEKTLGPTTPSRQDYIADMVFPRKYAGVSSPTWTYETDPKSPRYGLPRIPRCRKCGAEQCFRWDGGIYDCADGCTVRAERIARTETISAFHQGRLDRAKELGIKYIEYQTMEDRLTRLPIILTERDIREVKPPSMTRSTIDYLDGSSEVIPGLKEVGDLTFTLNMHCEPVMMESFYRRDAEDFEVRMPDGSRWTFKGYVMGVTTGGGIDGDRYLQAKIRPAGPMKVDVVNQRTIKKEQPRAMKKGMKKFYVGSNRTTPDWTHAKLGDAIAQAKKLVETGEQEEAFVVQIVRVVKKKAQPIVVESFKG